MKVVRTPDNAMAAKDKGLQSVRTFHCLPTLKVVVYIPCRYTKYYVGGYDTNYDKDSCIILSAVLVTSLVDQTLKTSG